MTGTTDLPARLRALSAAVRRHRALLAAGLTAAAVATALPVLAPTPAPTAVVLAAGHDLPSGATLAPADLVPLALPRAAVPDGALTASATAVGQVLSGPVRRGEPLTDARLLGSSLVPAGPGVVAAPVRLADPATAVLLHAGDRVDVLAAGTDAAAPASATAVATGLQVLAVPAAGQADGDGALVVLAATPATAARLAAAAVRSRLSVTVLAR